MQTETSLNPARSCTPKQGKKKGERRRKTGGCKGKEKGGGDTPIHFDIFCPNCNLTASRMKEKKKRKK